MTLVRIYTVDLIIFARFEFSQISRGGQIQESREKYYYNSATIIAIDNSRILDYTESSKIANLRKSEHAKITRSTVYKFNVDLLRIGFEIHL